MSNIIKDKQVVADDWRILKLAEGETVESVTVPAGKIIVPLPYGKRSVPYYKAATMSAYCSPAANARKH